MFRKVPLIGHPIGMFDLMLSLFDLKTAKSEFCGDLKDEISVKHALLMNTGIASFYLSLMALKKNSHAKEVILPCYTAPSLVVAVRRAGLVPVLCDISLDDFNIDLAGLLGRINEKTLCVVAVHMFGIPWAGIDELNRLRGKKNIFILEDCAQAFGARIRGAFVGTFGDIGFFSFNRGKNLPIYDGGCIVTCSKELASTLEKEASLYPDPGIMKQFVLGLKLIAISFAFRPFFYWVLYLLISRFKENSVPFSFTVEQLSSYPAAVGARLLKKSSGILSRRLDNGMKLLNLLEGVDGLMLPKLDSSIEPVFNRLPLVVKDREKLDRIIIALEKAGIESSRLYLRPLHHIFDLGYKEGDFPNAVYFAQRLLTLPVHPLVARRDIEKMTRIIKDIIKN